MYLLVWCRHGEMARNENSIFFVLLWFLKKIWVPEISALISGGSLILGDLLILKWDKHKLVEAGWGDSFLRGGKGK